MRRVIPILFVLILSPSLVMGQDFVTECTADNSGTEAVLCQTNGVWGTCAESDCAIAYCGSSAERGASCDVAGEDGACIPICEVAFDTDCAGSGSDLVCEIGATMDEGDETVSCSASGSPRTDLSLLVLCGALLLRRRRRT